MQTEPKLSQKSTKILSEKKFIPKANARVVILNSTVASFRCQLR